MRKRRKDLPPEIFAIVRKADNRLHAKYTLLVNRGKSSKIVAVAVARELAGFIWSIGQVA